MKIGEYLLMEGDIEINRGKVSTAIEVKNTCDRPLQIGSHFHFYEANARLKFDREKAYGCRLDIPAGTAVRFEPGESKVVSVIKLGGARKVQGANGLVNGYLSENKIAASTKLKELIGEGK